MTKFIIFAGTDDGELKSVHANYITACNGSSGAIITADSSRSTSWVGMRKPGTYEIYQTLLHFDTSAISPTDDVVSCGALELCVSTNVGVSTSNHIKARMLNWTAPLDASDWVSPQVLELRPPFAKYGQSVMSPGTVLTLPVDGYDQSINAGGTSGVALITLNSGDKIPTGSEYVSFFSSDIGTSSDPTLVLYTYKKTKACLIARASDQLSTGETVALVNTSNDTRNPVYKLVYYDRLSATSHDIFTFPGGEPWMNRPVVSTDLIDIVVDPYDNIFILSANLAIGTGTTNEVISCYSLKKTGSHAWAGVRYMEAAYTPNGAPHSLRAEYVGVQWDYLNDVAPNHTSGDPSDTGHHVNGAIFFMTHTVGQSSASNSQSRTMIGYLDRDVMLGVTTNKTKMLISYKVSPPLLSDDPFIGKIQSDVVRLGIPRSIQFAIAMAYETAAGVAKCCRYVWKAQASTSLTIDTDIAGVGDTHLPNGNSNRLPANGKVRVLALSDGTWVAVYPQKSGSPLIMHIDDDNNTLNTTPSQSTIVTNPDVLNSGAWDAAYSDATNKIWLYYVDNTNNHNLRRVGFSIPSNQWIDTTDQLVGSNTFSAGLVSDVRVPKQITDDLSIVVEMFNNNGANIEEASLPDNYNTAPLAPIVGKIPIFDSGLPKTISWTPVSHNPLDVQSAYELEIDNNGTTAVVLDTGKVVSSTPSRFFPANTIANNITYRIRVRTWDSMDLVGAWSDYLVFSTSDIGDVTITDPVADGFVGATAAYKFKWTYSTSGTATQDQYRVRLVRLDTAATVTDTGMVASTANSFTWSSFPSDIPYRIDVWVHNTRGQTTQPDSRLFTMSYLAPDPITDLVATPRGARIDLTWTVPAPTGDRGAPINILVLRRLTADGPWAQLALLPGTVQNWTDEIVTSMSWPDYQLLSMDATGERESNLYDVGVYQFYGFAINPITNNPDIPWEGNACSFYGEPSLTVARKHTGTSTPYDGRYYPVTEFGENEAATYSVKGTIALEGNPVTSLDDDDSDLVDIRAVLNSFAAILNKNVLICYRNGRGQRVFGTVMSYSINNTQIGADIMFDIERNDYDETITVPLPFDPVE